MSGSYLSVQQDPRASGGISRLSERAIELAYAASEQDPRRLAAILYFYNRVPFSRRWRQLLPNEKAVAEFLGVKGDSALPGAPAFGTCTLIKNGGHPVWRIWRRGKKSSGRESTGRFKLYVSPACTDLPAAIRELGRTIGASAAYAVKVGANAQSLLRPDKLMVYFDRLDDATRYARVLLSCTDLYRAHGVPFSHPVAQSGIVSVGFDPPETAIWSNGQEGRSWRLWVAECVAEAVLHARKSRSRRPIDSVREEIRARGIHPTRWIPLQNAWEPRTG